MEPVRPIRIIVGGEVGGERGGGGGGGGWGVVEWGFWVGGDVRNVAM